MLRQSLQQKLLQRLSPLQIQTIKLLELPLIQLEQRIKKEIEENPVLEEESNFDDNNTETEESNSDDDEFSVEDYMNDEDDDIPNYKLNANNHSKDDKYSEYSTLSSRNSLQQQLEEQLNFRYLNNHEHTLGLFIIGSIDDDGYLRRDLESLADDIAFKMNIDTNEEELETVLKEIQEMDPPGVGARDLQECLLIQLRIKERRTEEMRLAEIILTKYFEEFTKKHYEKIRTRLGISEEELKLVIDEITKLNPKPGAGSESIYSEQAQMIIPDFILEYKGGELELTLNSYNTPELRISKEYSQMISDLVGKKNVTKEDKEAAVFVKQKVDSAKWFIDAIEQRKNTLLSTMRAIIEFQKEYFNTGEESSLRPMILKDIAEMTGLDVSTISRVVNSKYIQTEWTIFPLRYFFSEGIQSDSGEEVSTREVKRIIVDCIEDEDKRKPYTDEELMEILREKGYPIARRTVAKYREKMNIPVGRLRKEL